MVLNRILKEKQYWDKAAQDPEVDRKYICDLPTKECLETIGVLKGKVLEIGCGVGRLMQKGYYGIDISEYMIDIAKKRKPKCHFKVCDGRTIPYKDNFFDSVYCVLLFQHLKLDAIESYISETSRVLKKQGKFIFQFIQGMEDEPFSNKYHMDTMVELLNDYSFFVTTFNTGLVHHQWTWMYSIKV